MYYKLYTGQRGKNVFLLIQFRSDTARAFARNEEYCVINKLTNTKYIALTFFINISYLCYAVYIII